MIGNSKPFSSEEISFFEALCICSCLLFFYSTTYLRFTETMGMLVLILPIILVTKRLNYIFVYLLVFFIIQRLFILEFSIQNNWGWPDQLGNLFQTSNAINLGRSIYTQPELSERNFSLYLPIVSFLPASINILSGFDYGTIFLFIPLICYSIFYLANQNYFSLLSFIFLCLNCDNIKQSAKLGNNELQFALLLISLVIFLKSNLNKWHFIPMTLTVFIKQNSLLLLPFYWIYLYKNDKESLYKSLFLSFFIILVFIATNYNDFYEFCIRHQMSVFPNTWLFENYRGNLCENFSVSTLINSLGIPVKDFWEPIKSYLNLIQLTSILLTIGIAFKKIKTKTDVLIYFALSVLIFFLLTRGFVFMRYVLVIFFPVIISVFCSAKETEDPSNSALNILLKGLALIWLLILLSGVVLTLINRFSNTISIYTQIHDLKNCSAYSLSDEKSPEQNISFILESNSVNKKFFASKSPESSILIDFGEEIPLTDFSISGTSLPDTAPMPLTHFLTSWTMYTPQIQNTNESRQVFNINNNKLNYCFDTANFKFNKPFKTRQLILKGNAVYSQIGGFVIKNLKFYNNDVEYKASLL